MFLSLHVRTTWHAWLARKCDTTVNALDSAGDIWPFALCQSLVGMFLNKICCDFAVTEKLSIKGTLVTVCLMLERESRPNE